VSSRKIEDLLRERYRGFSPLQKLLRQADNQLAWTSQLRALLPDPLAGECSVTDVRGSVAVIVCSNAGSATRLRFMTPDLLGGLRQLADFRSVVTLQIKVSSGSGMTQTTRADP
jgi:hypothetical protein